MRALRYAFDDAIRSLGRGRQSGLLSSLTIALALFVLGGFLLVTANLERLGAEWSSAAEMSVYLKDEVTPAERRAIESLLTSSEIVAAHEYVSKADALVRFKQTFSDLAAAVDTLGDSPLPAPYEGGIGALMALGVLLAAFFALRARYLVPLASAINLSSVRFLPWELCFFVVLGGMAVGCLGGLVAAWNR